MRNTYSPLQFYYNTKACLAILVVAFNLLNLPGMCNGCAATFTANHALDYRFWWSSDSQAQDAVGDLASLMWNPVRRGPIVKQDGDDEHGALIADLAIC